MFHRWLEFCGTKKPLSVLDVGSTPDLERDDSNCMLKWCLEKGLDVTAVSIENLEPLATAIPGLKLEMTLPPFPGQWKLRDRGYDWSVTSAVIEHVGPIKQQIHFLAECGRVSHSIFLTTPNRHHWLEFHTKLPFIHWLPKTLHRRILRALGLEFWSLEENLNLISYKELKLIAEEALGNKFTYRIESIWTLGMPSNLILLAERKSS